MTPQSFFALQLKVGSLMLEAQTVIALRLMAMFGMIPARPGENARMVHEKGPAMARAYMAATEAALSGKRPDQVLTAAMVPVRRRVRANRRRLTR